MCHVPQQPVRAHSLLLSYVMVSETDLCCTYSLASQGYLLRPTGERLLGRLHDTPQMYVPLVALRPREKQTLQRCGQSGMATLGAQILSGVLYGGSERPPGVAAVAVPAGLPLRPVWVLLGC